MSGPESPPPNRWRLRAWGLAVAASTLLLMIATEPQLSIVFDEGYTLGREARIRDWFRALRDPERFAATWQPPGREMIEKDRYPAPRPDQIRTRAQLFDKDVLAWFWPFAREEPHGHPPFYAIVGLAGDFLTPSWQLLPRARLGPMLLFSLTAGALWSFIASQWGRWAATLAAGAWILQPNLFANGHYATVDAILASLWVLALIAFAKAVLPRTTTGIESRSPKWGWVILFGLLAGWAADSKLTGWFLPLPFLAWTVIARSRRGFLTLLVGGLIGGLTLYAFNPSWWNDPIDGVRRFLESNLTRGRTIPIPVLFLGQVYDTPRDSLPWYNTLAWTLFVTPVGFLALAIVGAGQAVRRVRSQPFGFLAVLHWSFLLALRAMPHTPGHDGVRQFLPAFGMLAVVAGLGAAALLERFGRWGKLIVASALVEGAISLALIMPVPLSYFSPIIGGLPGAAKLGLEPTYFWDALTGEAIDWLNEHTPPNQRVGFVSYPTSWLYLHDSGRLKPDVLPDPRRPCAWFVIQNRPGVLESWDRDLIANGHPAYVVSKWGVPLVWIYPYHERESTLPGQASATQ
ncbi:glycosyltransferase family 39 protein [Singulisphaera sp. Ch08]|uniref:Glycosyltransferase family 39 protein n=1 Tax=Singulisphaera sp. Ch08 TaxID=3120278 RepID=A0AAU7CPL9_9BACT